MVEGLWLDSHHRKLSVKFLESFPHGGLKMGTKIGG